MARIITRRRATALSLAGAVAIGAAAGYWGPPLAAAAARSLGEWVDDLLTSGGVSGALFVGYVVYRVAGIVLRELLDALDRADDTPDDRYAGGGR